MIHYTIISDPLNIARRESLRNTFQNIGIEHLYFTDAIMTTRMSDTEVYSHTIENSFLTKGEVGCVLSHKKVYEEFLTSENRSIVIFEDDALFTDECTLNTLEEILHLVDEIEEPIVVALQKSNYSKNEKFKINNKVSIYSCHKFLCTHGYIINRAASQNILEIQTPIRFEIDVFEYYYWLGAVTLYCLNENLVVQNTHMESVIGSERFRADTWNARMARQKQIYHNLYKELPILRRVQAGIKHFKRVFYERKQRFLYKR